MKVRLLCISQFEKVVGFDLRGIPRPRYWKSNVVVFRRTKTGVAEICDLGGQRSVTGLEYEHMLGLDVAVDDICCTSSSAYMYGILAQTRSRLTCAM